MRRSTAFCARTWTCSSWDRTSLRRRHEPRRSRRARNLRRMHVCFFNRSYWPDLSATGQLLTELAEDLVRLHGWDGTVVTGYPLGSDARLPGSEWRHGVHIVRGAGSTLDPSRFTGRAANYVTYFASAVIK